MAYNPNFAPQKPTVSDSMRNAWQGFSSNAGPWIGFTLITIIVYLLIEIPGYLGGSFTFGTDTEAAATSAPNPGLSLVSSILQIAVAFVIGNWGTQAAVRTVNGERLSFGDFFKFRNLGPFAAVLGIYMAATVVVSVLLAFVILFSPIIGAIVAIVVAIALVVAYFFFYFATYAATDVGGPFKDAFTTSMHIAKNNAATCLLLALIFIGLTLLSLVTFGLGLLVVIPLQYLATAYVYRTGRQGIPPAPQYNAPYPQQF